MTAATNETGTRAKSRKLPSSSLNWKTTTSRKNAQRSCGWDSEGGRDVGSMASLLAKRPSRNEVKYSLMEGRDKRVPPLSASARGRCLFRSLLFAGRRFDRRFPLPSVLEASADGC